MVVLALETVTPLGSVAVWRDGVVRSWVAPAPTPHASRLPASLTGALDAEGLTLDEVDRLAVVAGPGSFTGIRIGMASVQGLSLTRGWQVAAVPTLDALAECWRASRESAGTLPTGGWTVIACLDGMRGEVFARRFAFDGQSVSPRDEAVVRRPEAIDVSPVAGTAGVSLVGSGAARYSHVWVNVSNGGNDVGEAVVPIAVGAVRLAARPDWPLVSPHALRPIYVRRPDVELARERARAAAVSGGDGNEG